MPLTDRCSKDVFLTSIFKMFYEYECLAKKRKALLWWVRIVDAASVVVPTLTLTIIGFAPENLKTWIAISGLMNVFVAVLRFFPFYTKSKELLVRCSRIETLINEMELTWRKYQLELISLDSFTKVHTALFEEFGKGFDSMNEVYDWDDKGTTRMEKKAMEKMDEYISSPTQITLLFRKIADEKEVTQNVE